MKTLESNVKVSQHTYQGAGVTRAFQYNEIVTPICKNIK